VQNFYYIYKKGINKKLVRTFSDSMQASCILRKSHQSWARQSIQCA